MSNPPEPALEEPLQVAIGRPAYGILAGGAIVAILMDLPLWAQLVPLAGSVVFLGLPHGAIDHLAPARAANNPVTARSLTAVGVLYLTLMGIYTAAWVVIPVVSFAVFIGITWFHWGQGDLYVVLATADHLHSRLQRLLCVITRGALPMIVPLIAFPETYRRVAELLIGRFDAGGTESVAWVFTLESRLLWATVIIGLVFGHLSLGYVRAQGKSGWQRDASETLGLLAFFSLVPPIFAIGLYFCVWHSARHLARLAHVDRDTAMALQTGDTRRAMRRLVRDAAPLTVASLGILAVLWWVVPIPPDNPAEGIGLYLVFIAVLTLPHVAVVLWMDWAEGVWQPT